MAIKDVDSLFFALDPEYYDILMNMEEQVISRAHRVGATRPIYVETLAMNGTIEEQMLKFLQDADECRRLLKDDFGKHDGDGPRVHRTLHDFAESNYLAQLSFVRTNTNT